MRGARRRRRLDGAARRLPRRRRRDRARQPAARHGRGRRRRAAARRAWRPGINTTFRQVGIATGIAGARRDLPAPRGLGLPRARARRAAAAGRARGRDRRTSSPSAARSAVGNAALARAAEHGFVHGLNHILVYAAIVAFVGRGRWRRVLHPPAGLRRASGSRPPLRDSLRVGMQPLFEHRLRIDGLRDARARAGGRRSRAGAASTAGPTPPTRGGGCSPRSARATAARSRSTCPASARLAARLDGAMLPAARRVRAARWSRSTAGDGERGRRRRQLARRRGRAAARRARRPAARRRSSRRARRARHAALVRRSSSATRSCAAARAAAADRPARPARDGRRRSTGCSPSRARATPTARGRRVVHRATTRPRARRRAARLRAAAAARAADAAVRPRAHRVPGAARVGHARPHGPARGRADRARGAPGRARRAARGLRPLPAARGDRAAARAAAAVPRRGRRERHDPALADARSREAAANLYDATLGRGPRRPAPDALDGHRRGPAVHACTATTRRAARAAARALPVLLVPPLAAPADLLRPAPRLLGRRAPAARGPRRPTSSTTGRSSSPTARSASSTGSRTSCRRRSAPPPRTPAAPVQVVGWCLGGIMSLLALAADPTLPVASAALIASPFDFSKVRLVAPLRPIAAVTRGAGITPLYRLLGGAPAPLVKRGYQLAGIDKYLMKPWTVLSNLHDRDLLAQIEAVDAFMDRMHAYPGRTFGQLYHRFFRINDLADGRSRSTDAHARPRRRRGAGALVAGRGDGIAPIAACHHVASLLPHARVELRDRARRPPRRPHRPRRGRDDVADPRRLPRRARSCKAPCTAGQAARSRCLSGYPRRPMRALALLTTLLLLLALAVPAAAQKPPQAAHRARRQGRRPRRRRPHGGRGRGKLQQTYGPPLDRRRRPRRRAAASGSTKQKAKFKFDGRGPPTARSRTRRPTSRSPPASTAGASHLRPARRPRGLPRAARRHDPHHAAPHLPQRSVTGRASTSRRVRAADQADADQPGPRPRTSCARAARSSRRA